MKLANEYVSRLDPKFYADTPKAVLAAIVVAFIDRWALGEGDSDQAQLQNALISEWQTLHANGIVPQPAKPSPALPREEK